MKIYEFQVNGEKEWVVANTLIEAIKEHIRTTGIDFEEYDTKDDIVEVPKSKWGKLFVTFPDDNIEKISFRNRVAGLTKPEFIASTAY